MITEEIFQDVYILKNQIYEDNRGIFQETYNKDLFASNGFKDNFVQDNLSFSKKIGTVRGLHFQRGKFAQSKLIRVLNGKILDVFIDIRKSSKNFGKYFCVEITPESGSLYIPRGFAHGFCTLEEETSVLYKVDNLYSKEYESGINWRDPGLKIDWPPYQDYYLSEKDKSLPFLEDLIEEL